MRTICHYLFSSLCLIHLLHAAPTTTIEKPDFTKNQPIPEQAPHDWNLGATGARGWIYTNKLSTSEARQIKITSISKNSPAAKVLKQNDVILGIGTQPFTKDPRTSLGQALTQAEATDGKLNLMIWRQGKTSQAMITVPILGAYSATAPYHCPKSKKIIASGCEFIAHKIKHNNKHRHSITRSLNALALLASGEKKYLPLIEKEAKWAAQLTDNNLKSWSYAYAMIFLSEYIIATKDQTYLTGLKRLALETANGQSHVGSWGHRFVGGDGRLRGYGMMNSPGIALTIGLTLAREAGVEAPVVSEAIEKSAKLLRFYKNKGAIPYGDHYPWFKTHEDNGKCGMATMLFSLLGEKDTARFFANMSLASHGSERDGGHTGNFFNMLWALPSVNQSGPIASGAWMKQFGASYNDLARKWNGSFQHQGQPIAKNDSYHQWDTTGAFILAYAMPLKKITLARTTTIKPLTNKQALSIINDGKAWQFNQPHSYNQFSTEKLTEKLSSWSPIVRQRAAEAIHRKKLPKETTIKIIDTLLTSSNTYSQLGGSTLAALRKHTASIPALETCLTNKDLWVRVKSAEAIAATGKTAIHSLPKLLSIISKGASPQDPRAMEQRFISDATFNKMLRNPIKEVDKTLLHQAILAGLTNEDGRSRGSVSSIYSKLSFNEIKPLLPAIYEATKTPSPSGIMFSSKVRLAGINLLAKYHIEEGLQLCLTVMDIHKWGKGKRIKPCLDTIARYGKSAKPILPELIKLREYFNHPDRKGLAKFIPQLDQIITNINNPGNSQNTPKLRSIKSLIKN